MEPGHQLHIESFFKENYSRLYYFAYKILDNKEAAEDVVHDVFVKLLSQNNIRRENTHFKSYVYTAIRNASFNHIRHDKVERRFAASVPDDFAYEEEKGLELIIRAEVVGQIHQAIEALPDGCKAVLKLAYFESLKNEEIATHLGISINTVKSQKARALQLLRLRLDSSLFLFFLYLYRS
jgi:RNA polymerase sigma-70 factor (family 1)